MDREPGKEILTVAEKGYGKRTEIDQYRVQSRGGRGVINMKVTPKTGKVIGAIMVRDSDEVVLLTSGNKIIRFCVSEVSLVGRATQGVRVVTLDNGGSVAGFDVVAETEMGAPS